MNVRRGGVKADRLHPLIPRETERSSKLYSSRGALEREFGRLKHEWAPLPLRVRGIERVRLHADLTILAKLGGAHRNMRSVAYGVTSTGIPSHRLKLRRALEHLHTLDLATQRWANTKPCVIVPECEVQTREHRLAVRILRQPTDPLMPLLIGDCAHNLRSAIDHLAYQLAIRVSGEDPPPNWKTTAFPVNTKSEQAFSDGLANYIAKKKLMPSGMYTAIEGLQPYNGGPNTLLFTLSELDNLDKHRFLPLVAASAHLTHYGIRNVEGLKTISEPLPGALEDGAPFITFHPGIEPKAYMQYIIEASIAFPLTAPIAPKHLITPLLADLGKHIKGTVFPALEPFL